MGATAALTALYLLLGQLETVTKKVLAPVGLTNHGVGISLSVLFAVTAFVGIFRYIKTVYLEHLVAELCTTKALRSFANGVRSKTATEEEKEIEFTESDILNFVHLEVRWGRRNHFARAIGLGVFSESTFDLLKDLLVSHMLSFGLIEAGPPHDLERVFRMKKRPKYVSWSEFPQFPLGLQNTPTKDAS